MPNWKKLIVSGSDANLNSLDITTELTASDALITNDLDVLGNVGIGTTSPFYPLHISKNTVGNGFSINIFSTATKPDAQGGSVYGGFFSSTGNSTATVDNIVGSRNYGEHTGTGQATFIAGSSHFAVHNGSGNSTGIYAISPKAEIKGTGVGSHQYVIGANIQNVLNNSNATVQYLEGAHIAVNLQNGTVTDNAIGLILDYDYTAGVVSGDLDYLRIGNDTLPTVGGTARAINSLSTLPSVFAGNIGIGTTSPESELTVNGYIQVPNGRGITFSDIGDGNTNRVSIVGNEDSDTIFFRTDNGVRMSIANGNVGIGTTSPIEKLDVNGNIRVADEGEIYIQGSTSTRKIVRLDNTSDSGLITLDRSDQTKVAISANFVTHGHTYFNGLNTNVGIGTDSPDTKLEIADTTPTLRLTDTRNLNVGDWDDVSLGKLQFKTSDTSSPGARVLSEIEAYSGPAAASAPESELRFKTATNLDTSATTKMTISATGNVGIGTTSPSEKLDIIGNIKVRGTNNLTISSASTGGNFNLSSGIRGFNFANSNGDLVRINGNGNVGIGTTSPSEKLDVAGNTLLQASTGGNTKTRLIPIETGGNSQLKIKGVNYIHSVAFETSWNDFEYAKLTSGYNTSDSKLEINKSDASGAIDATTRISTGNSFFASNVGIGITVPLHNLSIEGTSSSLLKIRNTTNGGGAAIEFNDISSAATSQNGTLTYYHQDGVSQGGGASWHFESEPDTVLVVGSSTVSGRVVVKDGGGTTDVAYGFYDDIDTGMYRAGADSLRLVAGGVSGVSVSTTGVGLRYAGSTKIITSNSGITVTGTATATTFSGDLNGTINTATTAVTKPNATDDTTVATTAFVQNLIETIPAGLVFQGTWNAATNTPTLANGTGTTGHFYIVSTEGSTNLDGITDWKVGDWAVFVEQGATDAWEKVDNSSVLDGSGTGNQITKWAGSGTSNTLTNSIITDNGTNVGIGTASPSVKLHVDSGGTETVAYFKSSDNRARISIADNDTNNYIISEDSKMSLGSASSLNAGNLTIDSAGSVGIGTTSPSSPLHIEFNSTSTTFPAGTGDYLQVENTNTTVNTHSSIALHSVTADSFISTIYKGVNTGDLAFNLDNGGISEKMRILANGNVGIGTTNPTTKLDVRGDITITNANGGNPTDAGSLYFTEAPGVWGSTQYGFRINQQGTSNYLNFQSANTTTVRDILTLARDTGNVGIGTTSPGHKLEVFEAGNSLSIGDNTNAQTYMSFANTRTMMGYSGANALIQGGSGKGIQFNVNNDTFNSGEAMRITSAGKVGIGTTTPSTKLEVSTDAEMVAKFTGNTDDGTGYVGAVVEIESNNDARGRGVYLTHRLSTATSDSEWYAGVPYIGGGYSIGNAAYGTSINSNTGPAHKDQSKLFITEAGNVGIGTTDPQANLHISKGTSNTYPTVSTKADLFILESRDSGNGTDSGMTIFTDNGATGNIYFGDEQSNQVVGITCDNTNGKTDLFFTTNGNNERLRIKGDGKVGIGNTTPTYKLSVSGGILAGGKVTYSKSAGSLDTTGYAVAGLTTGNNGSSAGFVFTCFGHTGKYQKVVYSCWNDAGTWKTSRVIDEGTNDFDIEASANGTTITFTFKSRSGTKSYTPKVTVEATGQSINNTYA